MLKYAHVCRADSVAPHHNSLSSRGTPDPDRMIVRKRATLSKSKPSKRAIAKREVESFDAKLTCALAAMMTAQAEVKLAKSEGRPYSDLAATARKCRAEYLALNGGTERRIISVDTGSAVNPMVAV